MLWPNAPQTNFAYGTRAPIAPHRPIRGFNPEIQPPQGAPNFWRNDTREGNVDDLPF